MAVLVIVAIGISVSLLTGLRLNADAETAWRDRAERDALQLTDAADLTLSQNEATLRSLAALFYASQLVTPEEFESVGPLTNARALEYSFSALLYAPWVGRFERASAEAELGRPFTVIGTPDERAPDAYEFFPVTIRIGDIDMPIFRVGDDLASQPAVRAAVATAYRTPDMVVMSPAFRHGDTWWAVMAFAAPNGEKMGVIAGLLDLSELFFVLQDDAPDGLVLRLSQSETAWGSGIGAEPVVGALEPLAEALETFQFRFTHGQARWQLSWDLLSGFGGGPGKEGTTIILAGSLLSVTVALLIGVLLQQNARIRRRVQDRTAELERARDEAESANRSKTEFLATMSHELRTPLNAIIGFSEMMRDQAVGSTVQPRYRDYAANIYESGTHLLGLINDILDVAKAEAGRLELIEENVALSRVVDACRRLMGARAEAAGVHLIESVQTPLPCLRGDERRLRQVVINLLSNAIKFTESGGMVTVGARQTIDGGLDLFVQDTGIGMKPSDIPLALAPFRQLDSTLSRKFEGTGLGLPMCQRLADLHQAELIIASEPGHGTTVTLRFPAARVLGDEVDPGAPRASATGD